MNVATLALELAALVAQDEEVAAAEVYLETCCDSNPLDKVVKGDQAVRLCGYQQ